MNGSNGLITREQRSVEIDIIKGILLLFICLSHWGYWPSLLSIIIYPTASFWVPCFFILSGYLIKESPLKFYFLRKIRTLLIPYLFFGLLFSLIRFCVSKSIEYNILYDLKSLLIYGFGVELASPLWFLYVLFGSLLLSNIAIRYFKHYSMIIALIAGKIACLLPKVELNEPYMQTIIISGCVYTIMGYWIKVYTNKYQPNRAAKIITSIVLAVITIQGFCVCTSNDFHLNILNHPILLYISPLAFIALLVTRKTILFGRLSRSRITLIFQYIANNGLIILATHRFLLWTYGAISARLPLTLPPDVDFLSKFVFVACTLYLLVIPFCNQYLYLIFGHPKKTWKESLCIQ